MHTIKFKNKRSKDVLTLQWERPEDLVNWANSVADQNGFEFRNVEAEKPIMLQGDDKPVHKLKIVGAATNKLRSFSEIKASLMSVLDSMQEEFEALMCKPHVSENVLNDKKNQIDVLNSVLAGVELQEKISCINAIALSSHLQSYGKKIRFSELDTDVPGPLLQAKKQIDDYIKSRV